MTEVRGKIANVYVCERKRGRKKEKEGLMRTAYFVCEPEGQLTLVEITLQGRNKD